MQILIYVIAVSSAIQFSSEVVYSEQNRHAILKMFVYNLNWLISMS